MGKSNCADNTSGVQYAHSDVCRYTSDRREIAYSSTAAKDGIITVRRGIGEFSEPLRLIRSRRFQYPVMGSLPC